MTIEQLMQFQSSNEAPFDHRAYTVWLHNIIVEQAKREISDFHKLNREKYDISYAAINNIIALPSLKLIK